MNAARQGQEDDAEQEVPVQPQGYMIGIHGLYPLVYLNSSKKNIAMEKHSGLLHPSICLYFSGTFTA